MAGLNIFHFKHNSRGLRTTNYIMSSIIRLILNSTNVLEDYASEISSMWYFLHGNKQFYFMYSLRIEKKSILEIIWATLMRLFDLSHFLYSFHSKANIYMSKRKFQYQDIALSPLARFLSRAANGKRACPLVCVLFLYTRRADHQSLQKIISMKIKQVTLCSFLDLKSAFKAHSEHDSVVGSRKK